MSDRITITIPAPDTLIDWFDDYVSAVELASGFHYTHDATVYGFFAAHDGRLYEAFVEPSRSSNTSWTVDLREIGA